MKVVGSNPTLATNDQNHPQWAEVMLYGLFRDTIFFDLSILHDEFQAVVIL